MACFQSVLFVCIICALIWGCVASPYDCMSSMYGTNQSWIGMYDGLSFPGFTVYHTNGALVAYDLHGNTLNKGTFEVHDGPDYCYATET